MENRPASAKPATTASTPSQSSTPDVKSPATRPLYSSKLGDQRARTSDAVPATSTSQQNRQSAPPVQQKAWTSAKNPITGQSARPQNNFSSQDKKSVTSSLREGQRVRITLASGSEFEGTYANAQDPNTCRLTTVTQKKLPNSAEMNGAPRKEQGTMTFQKKDIVDACPLLINNLGKSDGKPTNGNRSSFRTDAAISNSRFGNERTLHRWVPDSTDGLDDSLEKTNTSGTWDQFAANERLFGLKTDYDENIYTTTIDKSHPQYKERMAAAERKAREIERSAPVTAHVAEERVMDFQGGDDRDEEDKYSGVQRQDFPPLSGGRENKYTPPARRAPAAHSTVKGAPVDPAIISSQLKAPPQKQPAQTAADVKSSVQPTKPSPAPTSTTADSKVESKPDAKTAEVKAVDAKATDKSAAPAQAAVSTTATAQTLSSKQQGIEQRLLTSFKEFANIQRGSALSAQRAKNKADKEVRLNDLRKFYQEFKLSTPVPSDLISIIAKDPAKQKEIQEKALKNAQEMAKIKAEQAALKAKEVNAAKEGASKTTTEQTSSATTTTADTRTASRPTAPQHSSSAGGVPSRHQGQRNSYQHPQTAYHQPYTRGNRPPPHMSQSQQTGNLSQRLRNVEQHKMQHPHMGQHPQGPDMRLAPTGPANNGDPSFARRTSGVPPPTKQFNPLIHEFRPGATPFAPTFSPAGPSQASSPRASVNNVVVEPAGASALPPGKLIRRKTKDVDPKKCNILAFLEKEEKPSMHSHAVRWEENGALRPAYETPPTWRQADPQNEKADSTMNMTYTEYMERYPVPNTVNATPNPSHALPQFHHQHQLPIHMQHGAQNLAPRQSPHMPPMPMQPGQHGHAPHVPFTAPDDHRMMHSNSQQSFASPRMGHAAMVYPQGTPGQFQYSQPMMQPYMPGGAPQMGPFRSFSNNPQFMPQQQHHMGGPVMMQPQFIPGPNGALMAAGPQVQMYPGHPQFIPAGGVPPQPMNGTNGYPSPGRPAAPMMVHQGSQQGQPGVYGMSPAVQYQQPAFVAQQQPQGKFPNQRAQ
ncbi:poly(A)-binding protein binding protein [Neurospora sp. IMI 360204]|nr:poly(A)-binding protein binding protein [Neurospora sp. IMI 360204]